MAVIKTNKKKSGRLIRQLIFEMEVYIFYSNSTEGFSVAAPDCISVHVALQFVSDLSNLNFAIKSLPISPTFVLSLLNKSW